MNSGQQGTEIDWARYLNESKYGGQLDEQERTRREQDRPRQMVHDFARAFGECLIPEVKEIDWARYLNESDYRGQINQPDAQRQKAVTRIADELASELTCVLERFELKQHRAPPAAEQNLS